MPTRLRQVHSKSLLFWASAAMVLIAAPVLVGLAWLSASQERAAEMGERAAIVMGAENIQQTRDLAELMLRAEANRRAFVLTGHRTFLQQSDQRLASAGDRLEALQRRLKGKPDQLSRLAVLRAEIAAARGRRAPAAPSQLSDADRAREIIHYEDANLRIRGVVDQMAHAEIAQIQASSATADRLSDRAYRHSVILDLFVLAALAAAGVLAFRYTGLRTALIRRATAEAARRQAIFDSAMDAIVTLNPSGGIETVNKAAETMFGYGEAELVGRDISVLAPLAPAGEGPFIERLAGAEGLHAGQACELEARRKDGSAVPIDVNVGRMEQPDGVHVVAVMRDCTERRRAERAKDEFVSTVSHELRTPLTSIAGSLGLLIGGAAGALPPKAERLIGIAETNSRRLVRLINDILDIEKIQSGSMQFTLRPLEVGELARQAIEGVGGLRAEFGVSFDYRGPGRPVLVNGDSDRLMQVVTNLLSNAAKFSPRGGLVEVAVSEDGGRARVEVRDHGPGVPPEFRSRIFGKFAQADSSDTRAKSGTGLGLAITKEIVERHGGRIGFDSRPGEGAMFFVELPLAARPSTEAGTEAEAAPAILLCEDDADVAQLITQALDLEGLQVRWTATLADAEAALAEANRFRALLLDLRLPDGNGLELLARLRADPAARALPVIVISADTATSAAGSLDIVDWLEKPLDLNRLKSTLREVAPAREEPPVLLHVDDDPDLRQLVAEAFAGRCTLLSADSLTSARTLLSSVTPQLVILDIGLPDGSGLDLLPELVDAEGCALPVVIFSAQHVDRATLTEAVDAVLTKSRTSLSHLVRTVRMLVNKPPPAEPGAKRPDRLRA